MLISQQIAKNQGFFRAAPFVLRYKRLAPGLEEAMHELRSKILRAHKFIIPLEIMDLNASIDTQTEAFAKLAGVESKSKLMDFDKYGKRFDLYAKFVKLPYNVMVLENQTGLLLLERHEKDGQELIRVIRVNRHGVLTPYAFEWVPSRSREHEREKGLDLIAPHKAYNQITHHVFKTMQEDQRDFNGVMLTTQLDVATVSEILLLLNCANITIGQCKPTNKEASGIPKVFMPYYTYRILDIFRERRRYERLSDVETFLNEDAQDIERRAHFVRGHFKTIREVLHWWNPFMRNRRLLESHGYADKDYRLRND